MMGVRMRRGRERRGRGREEGMEPFGWMEGFVVA